MCYRQTTDRHTVYSVPETPLNGRPIMFHHSFKYRLTQPDLFLLMSAACCCCCCWWWWWWSGRELPALDWLNRLISLSDVWAWNCTTGKSFELSTPGYHANNQQTVHDANLPHCKPPPQKNQDIYPHIFLSINPISIIKCTKIKLLWTYETDIF